MTILRPLAALVLLIGYAVSDRQESKITRPEPRRDTHVIMISIDGLPPDYYTASARIGLRVPNLTALKLGGAYADGVEGIYPTVTYPLHTTMVTGARPVVHGIAQNTVFEPPTENQTRAWYWHSTSLKCETLWTEAKRAGLTTAAVGWPVTVGADIDYLMPEIWDPAENPITPKRMRENAVPAGLVDKATGGRDLRGDELRTVVSEHIIVNHKPNLMLIHLVDLDGVHHRKGTRSPQALETAERSDQYVGRIIEATRKAGIAGSTTIFLVSDHGFAEVDRRFFPGVVLVREKLITLDERGKPVAWKAAAWNAGGSCAIILADAKDLETAKKVSTAFTAYTSKEKSPLRRIMTRGELDKLGAIPQAILMLEAAPGYVFGDEYKGSEVASIDNDYRGTHGYLPSRIEMRASLIISGEAARAGTKIALARMIDIGPTIAGLLRIPLGSAEGGPIDEMLKPGSAYWAPTVDARRKRKAK